MKCKLTLMMLGGLLILQPLTAQVNGQDTKDEWRMKVSPLLMQQTVKAMKNVTRAGSVETYLGALVRVAEGQNGALLRSEKVVLLDSLDEYYIALIPASHMEALACKEGVMAIEAQKAGKVNMDVTHSTIGADKVQAGSQTPSIPAFTGKGVVVGISDLGFDYTHPMFRNADGTMAIKQAWDLHADKKNNGLGGIGAVYNTKEELLMAGGSRDSCGTHGTHVMGISAGRPWKATGAEGEKTYKGVAYEADIVAATGGLDSEDPKMQELTKQRVKEIVKNADTEEMMNANIQANNIISLLSIKIAFDYAKAHGNMPCVVNCSWSEPLTLTSDYTNQDAYLKKLLGPGRILVGATGNNGESHIYCEKPEGVTTWKPKMFTTSNEATFTFHCDKEFQMVLDIYERGQSDPSCSTIKQNREWLTGADIRKMQDDNDNEMNWVYVNKKGEKEKVTVLLFYKKNGTDDYTYTITYIMPKEYYEEVYDKMELTFITEGKMKLMGEAGALVFGEDYKYNNPYTAGWPSTSPYCIGVGATSHRNAALNVDGKSVTSTSNKNSEGYIVNWSSCGPALDGSIKPDVVAPGHNIISARSKFSLHTKEGVSDMDKVAARAMDGGEQREVVMISGTSMAAPVMTGVVALWLQAKPTLTLEEIKQTISRTSKHLDSELTYPNNTYGYGEVDAYAGLLDILGIPTSIPTLSTRQAAVTLKGRTLYVEGATEPVTVNIYNLSGRLVFSAKTSEGAVQLPPMPAAVYAVQAGQTGSSLIRL